MIKNKNPPNRGVSKLRISSSAFLSLSGGWGREGMRSADPKLQSWKTLGPNALFITSWLSLWSCQKMGISCLPPRVVSEGITKVSG